jgi:hypothetical protein
MSVFRGEDRKQSAHGQNGVFGPEGDKGSSNKPLLRSPLLKGLFPGCLNGEPQADHHDESTCARDKVLIEFEKISGCLDQSNRSHTYRDVKL